MDPFPRHSLPAPPGARTGIVLSGGGARGAYQVGVVAGILEVLANTRHAHAPFSVLCGTSVGAINAAYLASHAEARDLAIGGLIEAWKSLKISEHLRFNLRGMLGIWSSANLDAAESSRPVRARALLDAVPLYDLVKTQVSFESLHDNVDRGIVHALIVTALEITTGRTTMFAEAGRGVTFPPSNDPRRNVRRDRITLEHVLASAALPLVFPPRRIAGEEYCDGGVRFNTPIAPAIRAGADRLIVISLLAEQPHGESQPVPIEVREASYKNPLFLLGKVINALLLDPTHYDLQVLQRFNTMLETLESVLTPEQLAKFHRTVLKERNMEYRKLSTLVFRPSRDVGEIAVEYARGIKPEGLGPRMVHRLAHQKAVWQSDLVSFLCFDGGFADLLIKLGREDAKHRAKEILEFYAGLSVSRSVIRRRNTARCPNSAAGTSTVGSHTYGTWSTKSLTCSGPKAAVHGMEAIAIPITTTRNTETGLELDRALNELARWGGRFMDEHRGDRMNLGWALLSVRRRYEGGVSGIAELTSGARVFELVFTEERLVVKEKPSEQATVRLSAKTDAPFFALLFRGASPRSLERKGSLTVDGDRALLADMIAGLPPSGATRKAVWAGA